MVCIVHGESREGGSESVVGKICETSRCQSGSERLGGVMDDE